jgi:hypothetical protein
VFACALGLFDGELLRCNFFRTEPAVIISVLRLLTRPSDIGIVPRDALLSVVALLHFRLEMLFSNRARAHELIVFIPLPAGTVVVREFLVPRPLRVFETLDSQTCVIVERFAAGEGQMRCLFAAVVGACDDRVVGCCDFSDMRNVANLHAVPCALRFFDEAEILLVRSALVSFAEISRERPLKKT